MRFRGKDGSEISGESSKSYGCGDRKNEVMIARGIMMETKQFIYTTSDVKVLRFKFGDRIVPVLWNYRGLFSIIPKAKILNEGQRGICLIPWRETIPVPQNIAKLLIGEDVHSKCTHRSKSDTPGT